MDELAKQLCLNLKLLDFDFGGHDIPTDPLLFSNFFSYPRKKEFVAMLQFLFQAADPIRFEQLMKPIINQVRSDVAIKNVLHKWFRALGSRFRQPVTFFRVWGMPAGVALLQFLLPISTFALESVYEIPAEHQSQHELGFHDLLDTFEKNNEVLESSVGEFVTFRDRLIERKRLAESDLLCIVTNVRDFLKKQSLQELVDAIKDQNCSTDGPPLIFHSFLKKLFEEVKARRHIVRTQLNTHTHTLHEFHQALSSLDIDVPVLDGSRFNTTHVPMLIAKQLGEEKLMAIRDGSEISLHTLIRAVNALLTMGCKVLRCPVTGSISSDTRETGSMEADSLNNEHFHIESISAMCLRIFQRELRSFETNSLRMKAISDSSSTNAQHSETSFVNKDTFESNIDLNYLIDQMSASIQAMQPSVEGVIPKREDSIAFWSQFRSTHLSPAVMDTSSRPSPVGIRGSSPQSFTAVVYEGRNESGNKLEARTPPVYRPSLMATETPVRLAQSVPRNSAISSSPSLNSNSLQQFSSEEKENVSLPDSAVNHLPSFAMNVSQEGGLAECSPLRAVQPQSHTASWLHRVRYDGQTSVNERLFLKPQSDVHARETTRYFSVNDLNSSGSPITVDKYQSHGGSSTRPTVSPFAFLPANYSDNKKSFLDFRTDPDEFDLLGDNMDFIADLVPSSPV